MLYNFPFSLISYNDDILIMLLKKICCYEGYLDRYFEKVFCFKKICIDNLALAMINVSLSEIIMIYKIDVYYCRNVSQIIKIRSE